HHPSSIRHDWELMHGRYLPVRHTQPALPKHLPAPSQEDESDYDDGTDNDVQGRMGDSSEDDDTEYYDSD
ncbi:hypothetical protein SK128_014643, partial [Halocaridina rubra]